MAYFTAQEISAARNDLAKPKAKTIQPKKSKGLGGFIERNLSTIGSVALPVAGAALAPETGGLSLLASAALSGAGSSIGKAGQNLIEHKSVTNDLLPAAEQGVVGEVTGRLGSKLFSKTIGKTFTKGTNKVISSAAEKTSSENAAKAAEPFAAIPKSAREKNNLNGILQHFKDLGVEPSVQNMHGVSNLVTGENGVVSGTTRQILGNLGKVSTDGVLDSAKKALVKEAGQLGNVEEKGTAANGVLRSIRSTLEGVANENKGSLTSKSGANAVLDTVQNIEQRIRELGSVGTDGAEKRALQITRRALMDKLSAGGADDAVAGHLLNAEDEAAIHAAADKLGGERGVLAQHIISGVNSAKSLSDLRGLQKPFVDASELAKAADTANAGLLPKAVAASRDVGDATKAAANIALGNHYGIAQGIGNVAKDAITSKPVVDKIAGVTSTASKINDAVPAGTGNFLARLTAQNISHATPQIPNPVDQSQVPQSNAPSTIGQQAVATTPEDILASDTSSNNPFDPSNAEDTIRNILAQGGDMKDVATYLSNAKAYQSLTAPDKPSATQEKSLTAAKNAEGTLQQIKDSFNAAGGGQGKVGGFLSNLTGKAGLNSNTATYNDTATALAASLYKALGNTGTISDKDQELIAKLIPKTTDTSTTANAKIAQLENLLQQAEQNSLVTQ